jgi:antitoxin YefM
MALETTYTHLRANLASMLDQVASDNEIVIVRRKGAKDVALVPAEEVAGYIETAYLLRSPRNKRRLLKALRESREGKGKVMTVEELRREAGLDERG